MLQASLGVQYAVLPTLSEPEQRQARDAAAVPWQHCGVADDVNEVPDTYVLP